MYALITGGLGFIGSHLTEALSSSGWETLVIDDLSTGLTSNLRSPYKLVEADAGIDHVLDEVVPGTDALFHLAAVSSVQDALDRPLAVHEANLTMTLKLLEAAVRHKVKRFVFSSSAAVYGDTRSKPAREDMLPQPLSHYAVQKLACEHYCQAYWRLHGLETVCLRYFNVYGPRQRPDSHYSGVISRFVEAARNGQDITIHGDGLQTRDFVHVSDVVRANVLAATAPASEVAGKVFNIGTGRPLSIQHLAELTCREFTARPRVKYASARQGEIRHSYACPNFAKEVLRFVAQVNFAQGMRYLLAEGSRAQL